MALAKTVDAKDRYTRGHSQRVATYAKFLAYRLGWDKDEQQRIYYMGLLHDIGKIGIPEAILRKTSRLTDEEYDECLAQLPAVLLAVNGYWYQHPVTESELDAAARHANGDERTPPRQRSGHWVH